MSVVVGGISVSGGGSGGGGGGTVTSVTGTFPIDSTGGTTPDIRLNTVLTTQGSVLYRGAAAWEVLAPGIAGQVLTTNGPGSNASWSSGAGAALPEFVFDPLALVAAGNVYTDLSLLAADAALIDAPKVVFVRLRGASYTVPVGSYDFGPLATFVGDPNDAQQFAGLMFQTGAIITSGLPLMLADLGMEATGSTPIWMVTTADVNTFVMRGYAWLDGAGIAPAMLLSNAGSTLNLVMYDTSQLYNEGAQAINSAGTVYWYAQDAVWSDPLAVSVDTSFNITYLSSAARVNLPQNGGLATPSVGYIPMSAQTNYTPNNISDWPAGPPSVVNTALDILAARSLAGGITASRPASPLLYQQYFDTTLGFPVWWNGSNWVNAAGVIS